MMIGQYSYIFGVSYLCLGSASFNPALPITMNATSLSFFRLLLSFGIITILSIPPLVAQHFDWMELYGGVHDDAFYDGIPTSDGGAIVVGMSRSYRAFSAQSQSVYVARTDSNGNRVWHHPLSNHVIARAQSILPLAEDRWLLVGSAVSQADPDIPVLWIGRLNSEGFLDWEKAIDMERGFGVHDAIMLRDGNILVVGTTGVNRQKMVTVKVTSEGDMLWMRSQGDLNVLGISPIGVIELDGGDCLLVGKIRHVGESNGDLFMQRIAPDGDTLGTKIVRTPPTEYYSGLVQVGSNELVLAGAKESVNNQAQTQMLLARVDTEGNMLAEPVVLDSVGSPFDVAFREEIGLLVVGLDVSSQGIVYVQLDRSLNVPKYRTFPFFNLPATRASDIKITVDGSVIITGESGLLTSTNGLVMKLSDLTSGIESLHRSEPEKN